MTVTVLLCEGVTSASSDVHWVREDFPGCYAGSQLTKGQTGAGIQTMDISSQVCPDSQTLALSCSVCVDPGSSGAFKHHCGGSEAGGCCVVCVWPHKPGTPLPSPFIHLPRGLSKI